MSVRVFTQIEIQGCVSERTDTYGIYTQGSTSHNIWHVFFSSFMRLNTSKLVKKNMCSHQMSPLSNNVQQTFSQVSSEMPF